MIHVRVVGCTENMQMIHAFIGTRIGKFLKRLATFHNCWKLDWDFVMFVPFCWVDLFSLLISIDHRAYHQLNGRDKPTTSAALSQRLLPSCSPQMWRKLSEICGSQALTNPSEKLQHWGTSWNWTKTLQWKNSGEWCLVTNGIEISRPEILPFKCFWGLP